MVLIPQAQLASDAFAFCLSFFRFLSYMFTCFSPYTHLVWNDLVKGISGQTKLRKVLKTHNTNEEESCKYNGI